MQLRNGDVTMLRMCLQIRKRLQWPGLRAGALLATVVRAQRLARLRPGAIAIVPHVRAVVLAAEFALAKRVRLALRVVGRVAHADTVDARFAVGAGLPHVGSERHSSDRCSKGEKYSNLHVVTREEVGLMLLKLGNGLLLGRS
jgi:hypothetical protein